jgi:RNA polymerase sigma factor (sigma-70 family)
MVTERELFETYKMDVFRTCYYMLQNYQDAEDVTQEVFVKVFREDYNNIEKLKPWILSITMNTCRTFLKRKKKILLVDKVVDLSKKIFSGSKVEENVEQRELKKELVKLLAELPEKTRSVIILKYFNEMNNQEIADILQIPLGTVKSRANYGLEILRKSMVKSNIPSMIMEGTQ